jgi:hypothetical protein
MSSTVSSNGYNILLQSSFYNQQAGRFIYPFRPVRELTDMEIAIINFSFYNSFFNISANIGNNTIPFTVPNFSLGADMVTQQQDALVLPDGFYSESDMQAALEAYCLQRGYYLYNPTTSTNIFFMEIKANPIRYLTQITLAYLPTEAEMVALGWTNPSTAPTKFVLNPAGGTQHYTPSITVIFNANSYQGTQIPITSMGTLLGFTTTTVAGPFGPDTGAYATLVPQVVFGTVAPEINPTTSIIIRCNMICSRIGNPTDMLAQVPIGSPFGAIDEFRVNYAVFNDVVNDKYSALEIYFQDQRGIPVTFFDPAVNMTVQIKPRSYRPNTQQHF